MTRRHKKNRIPVVIPICIVAVFAVALIALFAVGFGGEEEPTALEPTVSEEIAAEEEEPAAEPEKPFVDPEIDPSYYMMINRSNPIPENYVAGTGELVEIEGKRMETNAGAALALMVADLRAEGMEIIVWSGYRTDADQEFLYNRQIGRQNGDEIKAATISAVPLTSEHQAGLAIDLSIDGSLTADFAATPQGQWLAAHCAEYGYILRYPEGKSQYTGIIEEPWHFRYVGSPAQAMAIMDSNLCMEEYFGDYLDPEDIDPYLPYLQ